MSSEHVIVGTKLGKQRPNFALSFGSSFNDDDDDLVVQDDFDLNDYDFPDLSTRNLNIALHRCVRFL